MENQKLEDVLKLMAEKNFEDKTIKNYFYKIGKTFFITKFEEYRKNNDCEKSQDDSLVYTVQYLQNLRDILYLIKKDFSKIYLRALIKKIN